MRSPSTTVRPPQPPHVAQMNSVDNTFDEARQVQRCFTSCKHFAMADGPAVRTVAVSTLAYAKMMLHAAKYPAVAVNGVFLGRKGAQAGEVSVSV